MLAAAGKWFAGDRDVNSKSGTETLLGFIQPWSNAKKKCVQARPDSLLSFPGDVTRFHRGGNKLNQRVKRTEGLGAGVPAERSGLVRTTHQLLPSLPGEEEKCSSVKFTSQKGQDYNF
eukprot:bmy_08728T0